MFSVHCMQPCLYMCMLTCAYMCMPTLTCAYMCVCQYRCVRQRYVLRNERLRLNTNHFYLFGCKLCLCLKSVHNNNKQICFEIDMISVCAETDNISWAVVTTTTTMSIVSQ
eukprot:GHVS01072945.1.p1 GENE.GHVS01072945.1~~GHVS01072945.1.p1  ORF type:complete len:111 (-),score=14.59 GHVS01072945.1:106-438(-)